MLHLYAAFAEKERNVISERTKAALDTLKASRRRLGNPKGTKVPSAEVGRAAQRGAHQQRTRRLRRAAASVFAELADLSANAAAAELDRRGFATARGGKWTARSIINVRARLD